MLNKEVGFIKISVTVLSDMWTLHLENTYEIRGQRERRQVVGYEKGQWR